MITTTTSTVGTRVNDAGIEIRDPTVEFVPNLSYPNAKSLSADVLQFSHRLNRQNTISSSVSSMNPPTSTQVVSNMLNRRLRNGLKCPTCSKVFSNSSAIAKHKLTHSDERKYVCHVCKKAFKRQDHLNGHKLTHASKKPHGCQFCEKSYSDARSLRRHYENAHTSEYESWCLLSRAAEVGEDKIAETVAKMTHQLSTSGCLNTGAITQKLVAAAAAANGGVNSASLAAAGIGCGGGVGGVGAGEGGGGVSGRSSPCTADHLKAVLLALPLEEPRNVACAVCSRRFKNQSALNGHMRLHGGYHLTTSSSSTVTPSGNPVDPQGPASPFTAHSQTSTPPPQAPAHTPLTVAVSAVNGCSANILRLGSTSGNNNNNKDISQSRQSEIGVSVFEWPIVSSPGGAGTDVTDKPALDDAYPLRRSKDGDSPLIANLHSLDLQGRTGSTGLALQGVPLVRNPWASKNHLALVTGQLETSSPSKQKIPHLQSFVAASQRPNPGAGIVTTTTTNALCSASYSTSTATGGIQRPPPDPQFQGYLSWSCSSSYSASSFLADGVSFKNQYHHHHHHQPRFPPESTGPAWFLNSPLQPSEMFSSPAPGMHVPTEAQQPVESTRLSEEGRYMPHSRPVPSPPLPHHPHCTSFSPAHSIPSGSKFNHLSGFRAVEPAARIREPVFSEANFFSGFPGTESQPQYSPITPASAGFSGSGSTPAFTFPPSEALLVSASSLSPQQPSFFCHPPRALSHGQSNISQPSPNLMPPPLPPAPVEHLVSSPTPAVSCSEPYSPSTPSQPYHQNNLSQLYLVTPPRNVDPEPVTPFSNTDSSRFVQHPSVIDCVYGHGPTVRGAYDSSLRHPMTPQHVYTGNARTLSQTSTMPQAAYSVPIMRSQRQIFFPDDSEHSGFSLLHVEIQEQAAAAADDDNDDDDDDDNQPKTPDIVALPTNQMLPQSFAPIQLSSVPTHKYHGGGNMSIQSVAAAVPSEDFFRNPPLLTTKKPKSKPSPIVIPTSIQHRANASRLRSPRLWTPARGAQTTTPLPIGSLLEPPPYTPPPMLSPNRRGSGLFSSIAHSRYGLSRPLQDTGVQVIPLSEAPKSAPAFTKKVSSHNHHHLSEMRSRRAADYGLCESQLPTLDENDGPIHARSLFFGDDNDDDGATGGIVHTPSSSTPDTEEAKTNSPMDPSSSAGTCSVACISCHAIDEEVEEEEDDDVVEDIGVPSNSEAKINIGVSYQVEVPSFVSGVGRRADDSRVYEVLLWHPKNIDEGDPKTEESLTNLMNLARSPAVRHCGLNMEYTFHLLCKFRGDFETTLRALLHESFTLFDRIYSETEYWTTEEIKKFQTCLRLHDKDFFRTAADLRDCGINKSVKACVEFYYVWKRMNVPRVVNRYRAHSRRSTTASVHCGRPSPEVVQPCEWNDLVSFDLGLQSIEDNSPYGDALTYNLRSKHTVPSNEILGDHPSSNIGSGYCDFVDEQSLRETCLQPHLRAVEEAENEEQEEDEEEDENQFPCRECGRSFTKVKSRNAHMKSHAKTASANRIT